MSLLAEWFREAREGGSSEQQAVALIARRLGETEGETRRILTQIGRVKLGAPDGGARRSAKPAAAQRNGNGDRPDAALDKPAMCDHYRGERLAGRSRGQATKATARQFDVRPHDVRRIVGAVEFEITGG
jgi:hypothetical protein